MKIKEYANSIGCRADYLIERKRDSSKWDFGHALLVAGSYGKMGAAVLAARACLRSGVGLLTVHVPRCGVEIMQTAVPEAMLSIDDNEKVFSSLPKHLDYYNAVAIGPGLGTEDVTQQAFLELLRYRKENSLSICQPLALDADALNMLAQHPEDMSMAMGAVITPHAREYDRLFHGAERQRMADLHKLVIVNKGYHTRIFAPESDVIINETGNPGMATAGSGDVLTGILLGLLAQHNAYYKEQMQPIDLQAVTAMSVWLHGTAGDKAAALHGEAHILASDIIKCIGD
ncbi:MAG: NAD(P)H-hydrate dehydratase [Bacteroidales bacterium]|nr:NAD(P)H-hydrate dehydratase [Bacteroidales bacterium]